MRRSDKATLLTASVTYGGMGLSIFSAPVLAQALGPSGRGDLAASFVAVQVLSWITFFGIPRGVALQSSSGRVSWTTLGILTVLGAVAAALVASTAPVFSDDPVVRRSIRIAAGICLFSGVGQLGMERMHAEGRLIFWNSVRALPLVLPSLAVITVHLVGSLNFSLAFWSTFSGQGLAVLVSSAYAVRRVRLRHRTEIPWRFSMGYWASALFDSFGIRLDQLLLAALATPSALGIYAVGVTCAGAAGGMTQALNHVFYSRLIASERVERSRLRGRHARVTVLVSAGMSGLVFALVFAFWEPVFGGAFEGLPAVTGLLLVAQILNDQWHWRVYAESVAGATKELAIASLCGLTAMGLTLAVVLVGDDRMTSISMAVAACCLSVTRLGVAYGTGASHRSRVA